MTKRKSIPKRTRFEVFKRDSFTCQYCGESAPQVVLNVDHIKPVSKGGDNNLLNLITSCVDCNQGKSNIKLDDLSIINQQIDQLKDLNERRNQLKLLMEWRDGLSEIEDESVNYAVKQIESSICGFSVSDSGRHKIRGFIKKHGLAQTLKYIDESVETYIDFDDNGDVTKETSERVFKGIFRLHRISKMSHSQQKTAYIGGILRNRLQYINWPVYGRLMGMLNYTGLDYAEDVAKESISWTEFKELISKATEDRRFTENENGS